LVRVIATHIRGVQIAARPHPSPNKAKVKNEREWGVGKLSRLFIGRGFNQYAIQGFFL